MLFEHLSSDITERSKQRSKYKDVSFMSGRLKEWNLLTYCTGLLVTQKKQTKSRAAGKKLSPPPITGSIIDCVLAFNMMPYIILD